MTLSRLQAPVSFPLHLIQVLLGLSCLFRGLVKSRSLAVAVRRMPNNILFACFLTGFFRMLLLRE